MSTRNFVSQFNELPLDTLSKNSDEAYYTSREEQSSHHLESLKDKEIVILQKRITDLNEINRDLTAELKAVRVRANGY